MNDITDQAPTLPEQAPTLPELTSPLPELTPTPSELTPPPLRSPKRRRTEDAPPSERGALVVILALVAVLSVLAVVIGLRWNGFSGGGVSLPSPYLPDLPQLTQPVEQSALPTAPTGDGTVLTLLPRPDGPPMNLQDIYKAVSPAVVSIQTTLRRGYSEGTGVLMSTDGYLITNEHVISGGSAVLVTLSDGRSFQASLVGSDSATDLAVLKIDAGDLPAANFGSSDQMEVGDNVVAIGNPLGSQLAGSSTMTDGILSAVNRDMEVSGNTMTLLQTTAALNAGNSGGALVNDQGQVIGITNMKLVDRGFSAPIEGLGFAIPTTVVKSVTDSLIAYGHVTGRPMLGITVRPAYDAELEAAGVSHGLYVSLVIPGSDAAAQGLRVGDLILAADGLDMTSNEDLMSAKEFLGVGDTLDFTVLRRGKTLSITIALVDQYQLDTP